MSESGYEQHTKHWGDIKFSAVAVVGVEHPERVEFYLFMHDEFMYDGDDERQIDPDGNPVLPPVDHGHHDAAGWVELVDGASEWETSRYIRLPTKEHVVGFGQALVRCRDWAQELIPNPGSWHERDE